MNLIQGISNRQDNLEDKQRSQEYDIIALKTVVRLLQGKTITLQDSEKD
jgi:hypothetical protein